MAFRLLISPSKTMQLSAPLTAQKPMFQKHKDILLKKIQAMDYQTLKKTLGVSDKIAKENYMRYQDFDETNPALFSYTGTQFKALEPESLSNDALTFLNHTLYIISGLYGLIRPLDKIALYRLPMELKLEEERLHNFWRHPIQEHLKDDTLINLASKEYALSLDASLHIVNVHFKDAPSHTVKTLRGLFVRHIALEQSLSFDTIKAFNHLGYTYDDDETNATTITFSK